MLGQIFKQCVQNTQTKPFVRNITSECCKKHFCNNAELLTFRRSHCLGNSRKFVHTSGRFLQSDNKIEIADNPSAHVKELLDAVSDVEPIPVEVDNNWATMPYPENANLKRDQSRYAVRPQKDPKETSIVLFPGQGTQFVGMGQDLQKFPIARDLYEGANEILGYDLLKLCLHGPKAQLDKTVHAQPAIMVTSLAALEKLKEERPAAIESCIATAGFSLGEITALIFSGALSFEKGLRLLQVRAEAMQQASDEIPGGMLTVFYGPDSQLNYAIKRANEWCIARGVENPHCVIASYLFPHCKVVAGNLEALKFLETNGKEFNLRKMKRMPVSGAFHSELMRPAVEPFKEALRKAKLSDPLVAVHSNVDGKCYRHAHHIFNQLPKQIVKPVRWEQTLHVLYERPTGEHFPRTFECGPGSSLKALLKNVNAKAWDSCFSMTA